MCDAVNAMLIERFIALSTYVRKEKWSQIHNQSSNFKKLVPEEQLKPKKAERRKLKIRAEISEIETEIKREYHKQHTHKICE